MRKLVNSAQMREADKDAVENCHISSIQLMENASLAFSGIFRGLVPDKNEPLLILCGTGNNGGDGLAIARILQRSGYSEITILIVRSNPHESIDFSENLRHVRNLPITINDWDGDDLPVILENTLIDAMLGSGLNKPLQGDLLRLVNHINESEKYIIAVDVPTGMRGDGEISPGDTILKADEVICFQRPKLSFFVPESAPYMHRFHVVHIGLRETYIENLPSPYHELEQADIIRIYRKRTPFSHKGTYGKALVIAGGTGMAGAAMLCTKACIYSGAGLTTISLPETEEIIANIYLPEAMTIKRSAIASHWSDYTAIAVGPGLGTGTNILLSLLQLANKPLVVDADALNFLAENPQLMGALPEYSILTPHMKEFDRLFGPSTTWWDRIQLARERSKAYNFIIVLKNRYSFIFLPDGRVLINPTGNPAMASGGMGDVLTGIIVSFLAQGYTSEEAAILGCYLHGRAGDCLAAKGMAVIPASQLIAQLPFVLGEIELR